MICPMLSALKPTDDNGAPVNRECIYEECRFFNIEHRDCNLMMASRAMLEAAQQGGARAALSSEAPPAALLDMERRLTDLGRGLLQSSLEVQGVVREAGQATIGHLAEVSDALARRIDGIEARLPSSPQEADARLAAALREIDGRIAGVLQEIHGMLASVLEQLPGRVSAAVGQGQGGTGAALEQATARFQARLDEQGRGTSLYGGGHDIFAEMFPSFFFQAVACDKVQVLSDGSANPRTRLVLGHAGIGHVLRSPHRGAGHE